MTKTVGMNARNRATAAATRLGIIAGSLAVVLGLPSAASEIDELARLGLPADTGRDEVEAYCGACHSLRLVVQQGLSRRDWEDTLVLMVEEHEMEPLEPKDHNLVVDYLTKHVSIDAWKKRLKQ